MTDQALPRLRFKAPEGSLAASLLLAFLAASGLFYVNIMPALVDGLVEGLGFTSKQAGLVASSNVYGAAAGAFTAVFLVKRLPWKAGAAGCLALLLAIDLISIALRTPELLIPARFVHGLTGGTLMGLCFGVIARTAAPDRVFGMLLLVQYGMGGLGLLFLPRLVPLFGSPVLFVALAAFSIIAMATLPFLGDYAVDPQAVDPTPPKVGAARWTPFILPFAAIFLFQTANMGVSAYVIGLGRSHGLTTDYISGALGLANWVGIIGALAVIALGVRFGRFWPFVIGMAATLAGTFVFRLPGEAAFFAANAITSVTWSFVIPYLLGMAAAFDRTGQMGALGGFFSKAGLASGPFIGAFVLAEVRYELLVNVALFGLALCVLAGAGPALLLDRARRKAV